MYCRFHGHTQLNTNLPSRRSPVDSQMRGFRVPSTGDAGGQDGLLRGHGAAAAVALAGGGVKELCR